MMTKHLARRRYRRDHDHEDEEDPTSVANQFNFRPRFLRRCVRDVLQSPEPAQGSDTTVILPLCTTGIERDRAVTTAERERRRENMFVEVETFNRCLCDLHSLSNHCMFNLLLVERNETVLDACLGRELNTPYYHPPENRNFTCNLRRSHKIMCRRTSIQIPPKETRFQNILGCLSQSLNQFQCPATTTTAPVFATTPTPTAPVPSTTAVIILVLAVVISIMLGVIGAAVGIFCWRKKKKQRTRRSLPPLMPKPEHASFPNLYDEDYTEDHIYADVKMEESPTSHPVPDLLSRVPSLPPMNNRTPIAKLEVTERKATYSPETYEPLLPDRTPDKDNTDPKTPVPVEGDPSHDYLPLLPGSGPSSEVGSPIEQAPPVPRIHPYDEVNESLLVKEPQDESVTTPKVVDGPESSPKGSPRYFILDPKFSGMKGKDEAQREATPCDDKADKTTPQSVSDDNARNSGSDTGYVVAHPSLEPGARDDGPRKMDSKGQSESDPDWDGYEIPVAQVPTFDIASSFKTKGPRTDSEKQDEVLDV